VKILVVGLKVEEVGQCSGGSDRAFLMPIEGGGVISYDVEILGSCFMVK